MQFPIINNSKKKSNNEKNKNTKLNLCAKFVTNI